MDDIVLSIVIPVYNVEQYLKECYESIYNDEIINRIQIILVDDGSTDNSSKICDELSKNKNTFVFHKKNGGLASARNYGMLKAKGKYITFIDSDDKIENKTITTIIKNLPRNETDLIFLNISKFFYDGRIEDVGEDIEKDKIYKKSKTEVLEYLSKRPKFPASACGKIYKLDFLKRNNIKFPDDNRISEDMGFSFCCILYASSYDKIELPFYFYRKNRENSITNTVTSSSFEGLSRFIIDSVDVYTKNKKPINQEIKNMFNFVVYEFCILLWQYNFLNKANRKNAYIFLKKYKWIMKFATTKRNMIIAVCVNTLGISITSKMVYYIKGRDIK